MDPGEVYLTEALARGARAIETLMPHGRDAPLASRLDALRAVLELVAGRIAELDYDQAERLAALLRMRPASLRPPRKIGGDA